MHLNKGDRVLVEGTLKADPNTGSPRLYTRQDGTIGVNFELNANRIVFLGKANDNGTPAEPDMPAQEEDDVPF